ncbi:hypothetical protein N7447_000069 [Penicillium robsamsonii]|uniref:uncharacterized protein n=1 Tax=Penicillium robsamsonii TaxID=1792511 RepID=UPI0025466333|nr:uncharacterized protein N7447_000069 [Penicillium robsamsonii]KAJ5834043.1 hypothetical protein N7447_000069 [Penicillium robsamsonii]
MTTTTAITHLPIGTQIHHTPRSSPDTATDKTYHLSGGAITGIVVVSFAAVAIVLLIIFRKRIVGCCGGAKTPVVDIEHASSPPMYIPPQTQPAIQDGDLAWQALEMSSEHNAIHEIGSMDAKSKGNGRVIHELS